MYIGIYIYVLLHHTRHDGLIGGLSANGGTMVFLVGPRPMAARWSFWWALGQFYYIIMSTYVHSYIMYKI